MKEKIKLDKHQEKLIKCNSNALVIAGAGSGKTTTIIEKIKQLVNSQQCKPEEILVISFTNSTVDDLKRKISFNIDIFTFHKLAISILNKLNINYSITSPTLLNYIVTEKLKSCSKNDKKAVLKYFKSSQTYDLFLKSNFFKSLCNFVITFINLYKCNNFDLEEIKKINFSSLEKKIVKIIFEIYRTYLEEKNSTNSLDLDDLIILASKVVSKVHLKYKYIIIDEFQDTSRIRLNLIHEIYKNTDSKIIVVGDDYQSIYRFSGCDLSIFLNFTKFFSNVNIIKLVNTYRSSLELIKIASQFIEKNPLQIKKSLSSFKRNKIPIVLVPCNSKKECLKKLLNYLINISDDIMILARNNKDIFDYLDNSYIFQDEVIIYKSKKIKYYTAHKSKGLEAKHVIIINCNNSKLGFPNKIENNKIINKLLPDTEIKYAEERRLFYVAITRAKEQVFLVYNKNNPSIFIKEIKKIIKKVVSKITIFK